MTRLLTGGYREMGMVLDYDDDQKTVINGCRKRVIEHCISHKDGKMMVTWPVERKALGYLVTRKTKTSVKQYWVEGDENTKFVDTSKCCSIEFEVCSCRKKEVVVDKGRLCGSLESSILKGKSGTEITNYVVENYNNLLSFIKRLPNIDREQAPLLLNDVWVMWAGKEQAGEGYDPLRVSKSGECLDVSQVVESSIRALGKNEMYCKRRSNISRKNGEELHIVSVSMMDEDTNDSNNINNYYSNQASLAAVADSDSPLVDFIDDCTLEEDLWYVLLNTEDYEVRADSILDNLQDFINMVDISVERQTPDILRRLNKTFFSEYAQDMSMVDMFSRIFQYMEKDFDTFTEVYNRIKTELLEA